MLASANAPHLPPGRAKNWNFTDQYEPGSTFKMVVAGAVLEEGLARPNQVFAASETGVALICPGALFHDTHKAAEYSSATLRLMDSGKPHLRRSDGSSLQTTLGFGSFTGFPGETAGCLRSLATWSLRSTPTIAIGHETR